MYVFMFMISNALNFLEPLILGWLLNTIQEQGVNAANIWFILGIISLFLVIHFVSWLFWGPARYIERLNAFYMRTAYQQELIERVMILPMEWHTAHHSGDTINRIKNGTWSLAGFAGHMFDPMSTLFKLVSSYIALIYFNIHASYIVGLLFILTFHFALHYDKQLKKCYKKINVYGNAISAKLFDVISNITTVVILRIERLVSKDIYKKVMAPLKIFKREIVLNETKWFVIEMCTGVMVLSVIGSYIYLQYAHGIPIMVGTISILYSYVNRIKDVVMTLGYQWGEFISTQTDVENAEEIAQEFSKQKKVKQVPLKQWKRLDIVGLRFSYHAKEGQLHLRDVHFTIKHGERIALVGESGSGKTTFMKLLRSLYAPKKVELFLDGNELKHGFNAISSQITLIPQEPELFATTMRENITMGLRMSSKDVKKFTDMTMFTPVIKQLPHGLQSRVNEKGVNLSGGQKQRLALARGLMAAQNKPIVLMDEPTSSVDTKNELTIYKNIFRSFKQKTIISSIHRLYLLPMFDYIYLFKNGRIVASGSLTQLIAQSPAFKKMWKKYNVSEKKKN